MELEGAPNIAIGSLPPARWVAARERVSLAREQLEAWLERERGQLPPWLVVGFGAGIAGWFVLEGPEQWLALICLSGALALLGFAARGGRAERALGWFALAMALGCALIWVRSDWVAAPRLDRPKVATFTAEVEKVEQLVAKGQTRLTVAPADAALPPRVRVSIDDKHVPGKLTAGSIVQLRARLAPPPPMALPGSYDFSRDAWFKQIGAVGKALEPPKILRAEPPRGLDSARHRLGSHIREQLPGSEGGIATALATGDQNAVTEADADAMRRSGLTHLLSVSGLHIAAVVGAALLLTLRLLALSERLALRFNLMIWAAAVGALTGIAYTLLTGAQVPTVRSCVAAVLVLAGMALGRDAISIRLLAVGALLVLLFRPEALAGASFQLSFAAVTAIIALHSSQWARRMFLPRDEGLFAKAARWLGAMVATGFAVELALIPLALFHFHRAGLYSVAANIVGIPLTTFVIMPLEAGAAARPCRIGCALVVPDRLGAEAAAGACACGGRDRRRRCIAGFHARMGLRSDGRRGPLAMSVDDTRPPAWDRANCRGSSGRTAQSYARSACYPRRPPCCAGARWPPYLLRDRSGDYIRDVMAESSGFDGEPFDLAGQSFSSCSRDSCVALVPAGEGAWRILATRSPTRIDWERITSACGQADIAVSDRWLPKGCTPRWLKLDRKALESTGGVAIYLKGEPRVETVARRVARHPWAQ